MKQRATQTGKIVPRDYGIAIQARNGNKVFVNPSKYALAQAMLETPQQIDTRIVEKAQREEIDPKKLKKEFIAGIKRKNRNKNTLYTTPALKEVRRYADAYYAQVTSNSSKDTHEVILNFKTPTIANMPYMTHTCDCKDSFWAETKSKDVICPHMAALYTAMHQDTKSSIRTDDSLTGLLPRERSMPPMPFAINTDPKLDELVTNMLFDYFVEDMTHYQINRQLLENPQVYTPELLALLTDTKDTAQFTVLRQIEEHINIQDMTETQRRYHAASKALERRIRGKLKDMQFRFEGYSLEFKNTQFETISYRFKNANEVYSICYLKDMPPIMVRKFLGAKSEDIHRIDMQSPQFSGNKYISLDDATRREALTQIVIPGRSEKSELFVPQILTESYNKFNP